MSSNGPMPEARLMIQASIRCTKVSAYGRTRPICTWTRAYFMPGKPVDEVKGLLMTGASPEEDVLNKSSDLI